MTTATLEEVKVSEKNKPGDVKVDKQIPSKTPQVLERYELKYTIPWEMVGAISRFIEPYCSLDEYSELSPDNFYIVNSLYFDSPQFHFLRNKQNECLERFNMRIRSYGATPQPPYFLEIKKKRRDIIKKYRAKINDTDLESALDIQHLFSEEKKHRDKNEKNANYFRHLRYCYGAEPKVLVQYRRKAYFSNYDEYARVTFDIGLRSMEITDSYLPHPIEHLMNPADYENVFDVGTNVILELKCYTAFVPLWMMDLIRAFDLRQRGFSKYQVCLTKAFEKYSFLSHMNMSNIPGATFWDTEED
ncbi:MAG TPA: polyphosphate polymerase domain-containing protein [Chitinispirillaceae bacterium]|nr:polyphosphate polymerase domain-containing protein [Chitinispirillaceae bacterium]